MPKYEDVDIENYRFIIYHGHIHILKKKEENKEFNNLDNKEKLNF